MEEKKIISEEEFSYKPLTTSLIDIMKENNVPKKKWYEFINKRAKRKREKLEREALEEYEEVVKSYYKLKHKAYTSYLNEIGN